MGQNKKHASNKVYRFNLPFADLCVYEQEDGTHRATLNGVLLPEIFAKDMGIEDIKMCCMKILFAKYATVLGIIEKTVKEDNNQKGEDNNQKGKCTNDLCQGHKQVSEPVPVQSEKGHGHEADKRNG